MTIMDGISYTGNKTRLVMRIFVLDPNIVNSDSRQICSVVFYSVTTLLMREGYRRRSYLRDLVLGALYWQPARVPYSIQGVPNP